MSFIGALIKEKGAKFFILAARTIIEKIDRVKFLIVGDEAALAKKIEILLNEDTLRKRMGGTARKKVEEKFDISTHSRKIERIYRKILMTSRKRP